jgi:GTP-binding protein
MHFVDECQFAVEAGNGGDGAVAFRREKYVPFGGPAGGDGGRGGDVVFVGDSGLGTLHDLTHQNTVRAESGINGGGKDMYGRAGKDAHVRVPLGTIAFDVTSGEKLFEITEHKERIVAARGGQGGRGNKHFATPVDRAPRRAEPGKKGQHKRLRLELKVMADVGLLGFPNVGKSTLIRSVSRAHPKVADYPFTTLEPHLGVVRLGDPSRAESRSFVIADIPGLIPGASNGAGLGLRFLRHVERTRLLVHLVTLDDAPGRSPMADYDVLRAELTQYDPALAERPEIVAMTKADLPDVREAFTDVEAEFRARGIECFLVSAATHDGIDALMNRIAERLSTAADSASLGVEA